MSDKVFRILFGLLVISAITMLTYYRGTDATPFNSDLFFWALLFGSIAALIDGSLGMAYGVTGIAFLLRLFMRLGHISVSNKIQATGLILLIKGSTIKGKSKGKK